MIEDINKDESYYFQVHDFITHKRCVFECGEIMIQYLLDNHEDELAFQLLKRLTTHDNSKLRIDEFSSLCSIHDERTQFTNAETQLSDSTKKAIKLHWEHCPHHPEHHVDINKMSNLDIIEMCIDWAARSKQYKTDLIEFVKTRQKTRFNFNDEVFAKILNYCEILSKK